MLKIYFYKLNETELDTKRERALRVLPLWRVEKYKRMIPVKAKRLSMAAGLLLRHGLMEVTGIELKEFEIGFEGHEKPYLTGRVSCDRPENDGAGPEADLPKIYFNLSHAGEYVALAIADCQVGIDVETKQDPGHGVAEKVFTPEELEEMQRAEDPERYFTRLWTRKEAYVKCTGTGISVPLDEFSVLEDEIVKGAEGITSYDVNVLRYRIRTLKETQEYALSVCVQCDDFPKFSLDIVEAFDI